MTASTSRRRGGCLSGCGTLIMFPVAVVLILVLLLSVSGGVGVANGTEWLDATIANLLGLFDAVGDIFRTSTG